MRKSFITLFLATLTISGLTSCNSHSHSYDVENPVWQWTQYSAATVTFTCSDCEETTEGHTVTENATITEKETVKATCEEDGYKVYEASATFQDVVYTNSKTQTLPKLGHTEDTSEWKYNETSHWHDCLNCGDAHHFSEEGHAFSEWKVTKEADHYNKGTKERYCTVCKYTENADIEMTKFTYAEVKALHDKFATFIDTKSYFISHAAEDLAYSIDNIDPTEKTGHESELTEWGSAANEAKTYFNENFSVVFDSEAMDTYGKTDTTREFYNGYGSVLKVNGNDEVTGEQWTWGTDIKAGLEKDIDALVFAVYNNFDMDLKLITDSSCANTYKPETNGTWQASRGATTCSGGTWTQFTIYVSELENLDLLKIGLYLMSSPYGGYGIPATKDAVEKGSGYITEVIGVKTTYYKSLATPVVTLINGLTTLDLNNITLADGTQINAAKDAYDALPLPAQKYVTNSNILQEYVDAYMKAYYTDLASDVVAKITALQSLNIEDLKLSDGTQIKEARAAYDALDAAVKKYVTNIKVLEDYEAAYAIVYKNAQAERAANIIEEINNLPALNLTDGVFPNISYLSVLDEYNELDDEYKATVTNRDKLLEFNDYFDCVVSASTIDALPHTAVSNEIDATYGAVRKFTCIWDKNQIDTWSNANLDTNINFDDYAYFSFAIYNANQFTAWKFTAKDNQHQLNLASKKVELDVSGATPAASGWIVITLSSADMKTLFTENGDTTQSVNWGPYLGGKEAWGLQINQAVMITNFYGIKTAYYESQAKNVEDKITSISSLGKDNLTLWNGGQILEVRSEYDALPDAAKALVTNYSTLTEYETTYAAIGKALNYQWASGAVNTKSTVISSSSINYDTTYGLYTEVSGTDSWACNFTPTGSASVSTTVKFAVYNPTENNISIFVYVNDWTQITTLIANANAWTELEVPATAFKDGVVSGVTFALSGVTSIAGLKLTSIYQAA